jgi:hypothetical protein
LTSGVTATHRETNPQIEYDLLLEEAWHINKAITEAQQKINDIHDAVPSLSKSLIENRLNNTEMEFYHRICNLEEQLNAFRYKLLQLKPQLGKIKQSASLEDFPLNRNRPKEIEVGLVAATVISDELQRKPSRVSASVSGKKPGPKKGPRKASATRRAAIKLLHSEKTAGLEACKKLNDMGMPLPSKRTATAYNNDWVTWFRHDANGFYKQWHADLKRG